MIEDIPQKRQVFLQVDTEIVRVPPQMKERSAAGRRLHRGGDAPQAQALQRAIPPYWPQETARRDVDHAVDKRRLVIVRAADRHIAVAQAGATDQQGLLDVAPGAVELDALVAAKRSQP